MSTKIACDACGGDALRQDFTTGTYDGMTRELKLGLGNRYVKWDLCGSCFERVKSAVAELTPHTPRARWSTMIE